MNAGRILSAYGHAPNEHDELVRDFLDEFRDQSAPGTEPTAEDLHDWLTDGDSAMRLTISDG